MGANFGARVRPENRLCCRPSDFVKLAVPIPEIENVRRAIPQATVPGRARPVRSAGIVAAFCGALFFARVAQAQNGGATTDDLTNYSGIAKTTNGVPNPLPVTAHYSLRNIAGFVTHSYRMGFKLLDSDGNDVGGPEQFSTTFSLTFFGAVTLVGDATANLTPPGLTNGTYVAFGPALSGGDPWVLYGAGGIQDAFLSLSRRRFEPAHRSGRLVGKRVGQSRICGGDNRGRRIFPGRHPGHNRPARSDQQYRFHRQLSGQFRRTHYFRDHRTRGAAGKFAHDDHRGIAQSRCAGKPREPSAGQHARSAAGCADGFHRQLHRDGESLIYRTGQHGDANGHERSDSATAASFQRNARFRIHHRDHHRPGGRSPADGHGRLSARIRTSCLPPAARPSRRCRVTRSTPTRN